MKSHKTKYEASYVVISRKAGQRCGNCSMFVAPAGCTLVKGAIQRTGWCKFWDEKKQEN